jgi:hypothetical protein
LGFIAYCYPRSVSTCIMSLSGEHQSFIRSQHNKLSIRQISKKLNLPKVEVKEFIQSLATPSPGVEKPPSKKKFLVCLVSVGLLAFLLRVFYMILIQDSPFFSPLAKDLDDAIYHAMAVQIAEGNFNLDSQLTIYRVPLYPYILGMIYTIVGPSIGAVHILQSLVLGTLTPVLLFLITTIMFKNLRASLWAGILAALYLPLVFYENLLVGESISVFLNLIALLGLLHTLETQKGRAWRLFTCGLLLGLSILLRPNTLIAVLFVAIFLFGFFYLKEQKKIKATMLLLLFLVGSGLPILPVTLRNLLVYKDFVPIAAVGGINLYIGNNPLADGRYMTFKGMGTRYDEILKNTHALAEEKMGKKLKASQVSSYWANEAIKFALSSPLAFVSLMLKKIFLFFNSYEFPDILDMNFVAMFLPLLKLAAVQFGCLVVLTAWGAALLRGQRNPKALMMGCFFLGYMLSIIMFFVNSRYRIPAAPLMIPFAAWALSQAVHDFRQRKPWLVILIASVIAFWPVQPANMAANYNSLGVHYKKEGDMDRAIQLYTKAIEIVPYYPSPHYNLAILYREQGNMKRAEIFMKKYHELAEQI